MTGALQFGANLSVAFLTSLGLYLALLTVQGVAASAGQVTHLVLTTRPVQGISALMTTATRLINSLYIVTLRLERLDQLRAAVAIDSSNIQMFCPLAMTSLTPSRL